MFVVQPQDLKRKSAVFKPEMPQRLCSSPAAANLACNRLLRETRQSLVARTKHSNLATLKLRQIIFRLPLIQSRKSTSLPKGWPTTMTINHMDLLSIFSRPNVWELLDLPDLLGFELHH